MSTAAMDLRPGAVVLTDLPGSDEPRALTVVEVARTGAVLFGQVGPDATPMVVIRFSDMPKPFKGTIECAGDRPFVLAPVSA